MIDWGRALRFFLSLSPERRSYGAVAAEFGVSVRTVERHGRQDSWWERAREFDGKAQAEAESKLARARAEQISEYDQLIEAAIVHVAREISAGRAKPNVSDLLRLIKGRLELWQLDQPSTPATLPALPPRTGPSREHKLEVLKALHESGALHALERELTQPADSREPGKEAA